MPPASRPSLTTPPPRPSRSGARPSGPRPGSPAGAGHPGPAHRRHVRRPRVGSRAAPAAPRLLRLSTAGFGSIPPPSPAPAPSHPGPAPGAGRSPYGSLRGDRRRGLRAVAAATAREPGRLWGAWIRPQHPAIRCRSSATGTADSDRGGWNEQAGARSRERTAHETAHGRRRRPPRGTASGATRGDRGVSNPQPLEPQSSALPLSYGHRGP